MKQGQSAKIAYKVMLVSSQTFSLSISSATSTAVAIPADRISFLLSNSFLIVSVKLVIGLRYYSAVAALAHVYFILHSKYPATVITGKLSNGCAIPATSKTKA